MARAENINPEILVWARDTAGLSPEEAAARLHMTDTRKHTAIEKLTRFETGESKPTRRQLVKIANLYKRPLTAFYRSEPPIRSERVEDFRTIAGNVSREESGRLEALLRDVRVRQDMVKSVLEDDEDFSALPFVGAIGIDQSVSITVSLIRRLLQLEEGDSRAPIRSADDHFKDLRTRIEAIGVYVLLIGNLGSHHSTISEKAFRGFAIADDFAPFIVINDQDAVAARIFTLIHEFTHILVGSTGISSSPTTSQATTPQARVERYCNDVAGEFLVPTTILSSQNLLTSQEAIQLEISRIAELLHVSEPMVAYRFARMNLIDSDAYSQLTALHATRLRAKKQREKQAQADADRGPNYYVVKRHRIGQGLLSLVSQTLRANELTYTKAAKMLGVKPSSVEPLIQDMRPMQKRRVGEVV